MQNVEAVQRNLMKRVYFFFAESNKPDVNFKHLFKYRAL